MKQNILDVNSQLPCSSASTCLTLFYICISLYWVVVVGIVGSVLQYCKLLVACSRKLLSLRATKNVLLILNSKNRSRSLKQTNKTTKPQN